MSPNQSIIAVFQPTRPLRGATKKLDSFTGHTFISTHAPLAGRDDCTTRQISRRRYFNPRAPCGARRQASNCSTTETQKFQPTRPLRGATQLFHGAFPMSFISTHAPLAGRDREVADDPSPFSISTHAPLAGRDIDNYCKNPYKLISTHAPLAGRDSTLPRLASLMQISTHAPLAGRDPLFGL